MNNKEECEKIKNHFEKAIKYNPKDGNFYWKVDYSNNRWNFYKGEKVGNNHYGYIRLSYDNINILAHRLVFIIYTGLFPKEIDHINGIRDDNRWCNLRKVTSSENNKNLPIRRDNITKIIGVSWSISNNKWQSYISNNKKQIHLGYYIDFFEACCIRKSAELKYNYHENHGRK